MLGLQEDGVKVKEGEGVQVSAERCRLQGECVEGSTGISSVLPPLSNSSIILITWLYIALNRTLNIDCYWVRAVPKA